MPDEFGREEGVDYASQVWTLNGESIVDYTGAEDAEDPSAYVKVYRYLATGYDSSKKVPPYALDFVTGLNRRLYRDEYFVQGELRRVDYYADYLGKTPYNEPIYDDLIVRENIAYVRDSLGFAQERTTVITWYKEDDSAHGSTKSLHKVYSMLESQKEGVTRRGNIVKHLAVRVAGMLIATVPASNAYGTFPTPQSKLQLGREFLRAHNLDMQSFIDASDQTVVGVVKHATEWWLNNPIGGGLTIRDYIRSEIDIMGIWDSV